MWTSDDGQYSDMVEEEEEEDINKEMTKYLLLRLAREQLVWGEAGWAGCILRGSEPLWAGHR